MRVLHNARIYTFDPTQPVVSALAINHGRIVAAGNKEFVSNAAQAVCQVENVDMKGQIVLPGLVDSHLHLEMYALSLQQVNCETRTKDECLQRVADRVKLSRPGQWIVGHGWNQNVWEGGFGCAADLDQVAPENPVYLTDKSIHAAWANSLALRLAGIDSGTPDPQGGHIGHDSSGQPNGILFEDAVLLVENIIPHPTVEQIASAIQTAQDTLLKMGLTGVHDFDRRRCFAALQILRERGQLKIRVVKGMPVSSLDDIVSLGLRSGFGDEFLRLGSLKLFADGALGPQTAAMFQPYENTTNQYGDLLLDSEQILEIGQEATQNGWSLAIHAIGDRANHEVLDAYTHLRRFEKQNHLPHLRHRIEHVQCLHPDDISRLAELDVIASMQPYHVISDMFTADHHWGDRAKYAYAYHSLQKHKTHLTFGSDAPVESPNPFWGLHAAVFRQQLDGRPGPQGWNGQERLSLQTALEAYTIEPAYTSGQEHSQGRLATGYLADLIVLEQDPFTATPSELYHMIPTAVMVGGNWVC